jgi:hypothetical protein
MAASPGLSTFDIEIGFFDRLEDQYQTALEDLRIETMIWAGEDYHPHQD